ncbi:hypothetical protein [Brevibacterium sp.]|uniref:hypothetical protein n=1 Tax=Brevibacterium sp. TaxID=1701 RepID=UPI0025BC1182|nr:hypothetical protein [Brevibacterium sp.]
MSMFLAISYGDEAGYESTPIQVRRHAHAHDERLRERGVRMSRAGEPIQVRNTELKEIRQEPGAYLRSALPVAGFSLLEADSLEEAAALLAESPCAVAHGVVEVWPLEDWNQQD